MCEVRACARALVQRVAEGGEIPIASLRELGDLVLRSELMVVSLTVGAVVGHPFVALFIEFVTLLCGLLLVTLARCRERMLRPLIVEWRRTHRRVRGRPGTARARPLASHQIFSRRGD
jgi:hypothetical protein